MTTTKSVVNDQGEFNIIRNHTLKRGGPYVGGSIDDLYSLASNGAGGMSINNGGPIPQGLFYNNNKNNNLREDGGVHDRYALTPDKKFKKRSKSIDIVCKRELMVRNKDRWDKGDSTVSAFQDDMPFSEQNSFASYELITKGRQKLFGNYLRCFTPPLIASSGEFMKQKQLSSVKSTSYNHHHYINDNNITIGGSNSIPQTAAPPLLTTVTSSPAFLISQQPRCFPSTSPSEYGSPAILGAVKGEGPPSNIPLLKDLSTGGERRLQLVNSFDGSYEVEGNRSVGLWGFHDRSRVEKGQKFTAKMDEEQGDFYQNNATGGIIYSNNRYHKREGVEAVASATVSIGGEYSLSSRQDIPFPLTGNAGGGSPATTRIRNAEGHIHDGVAIYMNKSGSHNNQNNGGSGDFSHLRHELKNQPSSGQQSPLNHFFPPAPETPPRPKLRGNTPNDSSLPPLPPYFSTATLRRGMLEGCVLPLEAPLSNTSTAPSFPTFSKPEAGNPIPSKTCPSFPLRSVYRYDCVGGGEVHSAVTDGGSKKDMENAGGDPLKLGEREWAEEREPCDVVVFASTLQPDVLREKMVSSTRDNNNNIIINNNTKKKKNNNMETVPVRDVESAAQRVDARNIEGTGLRPPPPVADSYQHFTNVSMGMMIRKWVVHHRLGAGSFGETFAVVEVPDCFDLSLYDQCVVKAIDKYKAEHKGVQIPDTALTMQLQETSPGASDNIKEIAERNKSIAEEAMRMLPSSMEPVRNACIKAEQDNKNVLRLEVMALKKCLKCPQVVKYIGSGHVDMIQVNYVAMEKLGPNLTELRKACPHGIFDVYTMLKVGVSCLKAIRQVHEEGLVHRDIKPSNFVVGGGPIGCKTCFLIDFGLARRYRRENGEIRSPRAHAGFRGTNRYASIESHLGHELSRADDLWSLLFVLVEMAIGSLPWRKFKDKETIGECKMQTVNGDLVDSLPREFLPFLEHLQTLTYKSEPDYDLLISLLETALVRRGYPAGKPLDYEKNAYQLLGLNPSPPAMSTAGMPMTAVPAQHSSASPSGTLCINSNTNLGYSANIPTTTVHSFEPWEPNQKPILPLAIVPVMTTLVSGSINYRSSVTVHDLMGIINVDNNIHDSSSPLVHPPLSLSTGKHEKSGKTVVVANPPGDKGGIFNGQQFPPSPPPLPPPPSPSSMPPLPPVSLVASISAGNLSGHLATPPGDGGGHAAGYSVQQQQLKTPISPSHPTNIAIQGQHLFLITASVRKDVPLRGRTKGKRASSAMDRGADNQSLNHTTDFDKRNLMEGGHQLSYKRLSMDDDGAVGPSIVTANAVMGGDKGILMDDKCGLGVITAIRAQVPRNVTTSTAQERRQCGSIRFLHGSTASGTNRNDNNNPMAPNATASVNHGTNITKLDEEQTDPTIRSEQVSPSDDGEQEISRSDAFERAGGGRGPFPQNPLEETPPPPGLGAGGGKSAPLPSVSTAAPVGGPAPHTPPPGGSLSNPSKTVAVNASTENNADAVVAEKEPCKSFGCGCCIIM